MGANSSKHARGQWLAAVMIAAGALIGGGRAEGANPPLTGDLKVHDPSTIVTCGDEYWLFATGSGIVSRRSKDLVQWEDKGMRTRE